MARLKFWKGVFINKMTREDLIDALEECVDEITRLTGQQGNDVPQQERRVIPIYSGESDGTPGSGMGGA
jgi:hypothetical protein